MSLSVSVVPANTPTITNQSSGLRLAVVGSRNFPNEKLARTLIARNLTYGTILVSGGAQGPDTWAEERANALDLKKEIWVPLPEKNGGNFAAAAKERNTRIVDTADVVLAFWDGESRGTKDTIDKAMASRTDLVVVRPDGTFTRIGFGQCSTT